MTEEIQSVLQSMMDRMEKIELAVNQRKEEIASLATNLNLITSDDSESNSSENSKNLKNPISNNTIKNEENNREFIPARDAVKLIKKFNGQDDIGVESFITLVNKIKEQCSNPEILLNWIMSERIEGDAEKAIRFLNIETFDELFETLRSNFGAMGSLETHRTKLAQVIQGNIEPTQNYNIRFNQKRNELLYAVQSKYTTNLERKISIQNEEQTILEKYILNLREDISDKVLAKNPKEIREAQLLAVQSEVWLIERNKIRNKTPLKTQPVLTPTFKKVIPMSKPGFQTRYQTLNKTVPNHNVPLEQRMQIVCNFCKKLGHKENQCYSKQQNFPARTTLNRPPGRVNNLMSELPEVMTTENSEEIVEENLADEIEYQQLQDNSFQYEEIYQEQHEHPNY